MASKWRLTKPEEAACLVEAKAAQQAATAAGLGHAVAALAYTTTYNEAATAKNN